ncbi:magnesium/cobalt transporter CorA [candidate division KSB1 bacterium]
MNLKLFKKQSKKIGLAPGTPVFIGEKKVDKIRITVLDYDQNNLNKRELNTIEEAFTFKDTPTVSWLNIDGLHDTEHIEKICNHFGIHMLVKEDILNTGQRPKYEVFNDYIYIVLKMIYYDDKNVLNREQVSIILGKQYVITFQEQTGDIFDPLRERINTGKIRQRRNTADYLVYAIMDILIDNYFLVLEQMNSRLDELDSDVSDNPDKNIIAEVKAIKRELLLLKKLIWPVREIVEDIINEEHDLICETTIPFLRDLRDHTMQVIETVELFREISNSIVNNYDSYLNSKMNEVMKTLTLVASIFIPLTFIAGIYGMNFKYIPELESQWGYFVVLSIFAIIIASMIYYYKRKNWF